jgi:hypothetical protein
MMRKSKWLEIRNALKKEYPLSISYRSPLLPNRLKCHQKVKIDREAIMVMLISLG